MTTQRRLITTDIHREVAALPRLQHAFLYSLGFVYYIYLTAAIWFILDTETAYAICAIVAQILCAICLIPFFGPVAVFAFVIYALYNLARVYTFYNRFLFGEVEYIR